MKKYLLFTSAILLLSCQSQQKSSPTSKSLASDSIIKEADLLAKEVAETDAWSVNSFVDEFGEKSQDSYIETKAVGTFSNSATSDEALFVTLLVTTKNAGLFLHEYRIDRQAAKFIGTGKLRMKNEQGKDITVYTYSSWNQEGGLSFSGADFKKFRDFLLNSTGKVKAVVYDDYSSVYNFTIDLTSFSKHFNEMKDSKPKK